MPYAGFADGRGYALFPKETQNPSPLDGYGKVFTKEVLGVVELFYQDDDGVITQITPLGSVPTGIASIVWRPGVPSSGSAVATWAEVAALISANQGALTVFIDPRFGVPHVDAVTDCFAATRFAPFSLSPSSGVNEIVIDDGAQLINPAVFAGNMNVHGTPTLLNSVSMTIGSPLFVREGAAFTQDAGSTLSFVQNTNVGFGQVVLLEGAVFMNNEPTIPMVDTVANGFFVLATVLTFLQPVPSTMMGGGLGGSLFWLTDSTIVQNQQTFYLGTQINQRTSLQGAIQPESGGTGARPTYSLQVGQMYFDTDLGIPIWYNGANWVNASGVVV